MRRLKTLWKWLNLPCRDFARMSSQAFDRDLTLAERLALRVHLFSCRACHRHERQLAFLRRAMRRLVSRLELAEGDDLPGPCLPPETRQTIERALSER